MTKAPRWDAQEIVIKFIPKGRPIGRKEERVSIFRAYGEVKSRVAQTIFSRIIGHVVYLDAVRNGNSVQTIPVIDSGTYNSYSVYVADFILAAANKGCTVECYGSKRERWVLDFECKDAVRDELDTQSDSSSGRGSNTSCPSVEPNGIRTEF